MVRPQLIAALMLTVALGPADARAGEEADDRTAAPLTEKEAIAAAPSTTGIITVGVSGLGSLTSTSGVYYWTITNWSGTSYPAAQPFRVKKEAVVIGHR